MTYDQFRVLLEDYPNVACVWAEAAHLVAIDHEVVCGDEGLKHNHPAGIGRPLKQRVSQLGNVHVHLVGAVDQIWGRKQNNMILVRQCIRNNQSK